MRSAELSEVVERCKGGGGGVGGGASPVFLAIQKQAVQRMSWQSIFTPSPPQRPEIRSSVINMNMDELLDIEEALLALRELYHRKLINAKVYVDESMKHSERIRA